MTVSFTGPLESEHTVEGALAFENNVLAIEYEKERWFGKPYLEQIRIAIDDIDYVEYHKSIWGSKIRLRMLHFENARMLPWRDGLTVDFVVAKRERERAIALVEQIEAAIDAQEDQQP